MVLIFIVFTLAIGAIWFKQRTLAILLIVLALVSTLGVFWHHVTNVLNIKL